MKKYLLIFILLILVGFAVYWVVQTNQTNNQVSKNNQSPTPAPSQTSLSDSSQPSALSSQLSIPIDQFQERITKKPFGIYITPNNSPVQPERFSGYHAGVDVEYQDIIEDVSVYAINDGTVVASQWVSGYGGVIIIKVEIDGKDHSVLYGHIRPSSLAKINTLVSKGQPIGMLGTGYSTETDNERRHLHFAIISDDRLDYKGYIQNQSDLSDWIDPLSFYTQ